MAAEWQEGIVNLWPTAFVQRRLPDHRGRQVSYWPWCARWRPGTGT